MFKKILIIILIFNCIFVFSGCDNSKSTTNNDIEKTDINNQNSTKEPELKEITSTGEISYDLFKNNLTPENVIDYYDYINQELFPFVYKSTYGYADVNGNVKIKNEYKSACNFVDDKAFVQTTDDVWHIIDTKGKILFDFPTDINLVGLSNQLYFKKGTSVIAKFITPTKGYGIQLLIIKDDFSLKTIDITSRDEFKITNPDTKFIPINTDEFLGVMAYNHKDSFYEVAIFDETGDLFLKYDSKNMKNTKNSALSKLTELTPKEMIFFNDGYVNVMNNDGLWGIMNIKTKDMLIDYKYDYIGKYSKFGIPFCNYGKWGSCNSDGKETDDERITYISNYDKNGNYFSIMNDSEYYINDKKVSCPDVFKQRDGYSFVYPFTNTGVALIGSPNQSTWIDFYLISKNGNILEKFDGLNRIDYLTNKYLFANKKMYEIGE